MNPSPAAATSNGGCSGLAPAPIGISRGRAPPGRGGASDNDHRHHAAAPHDHLVALALVTGAGTAALQAGKRNAARAADGPAVALQLAPADLTYVERTPLARWLPVSGTLQPVHQAIVEAKVAGDIAGLGIRDGEAVRAGQRIARVESADLASRLVDRVGVVESAQAQLALAEKMRAMTCGS